MSQFYGSIKGSGKTESTRGGSKNSGINAHVRGWDVGVEIEGVHFDGRDIFNVYVTSGSNGGKAPILVGSVSLDGDGNPVFDRARRRVTG